MTTVGVIMMWPRDRSRVSRMSNTAHCTLFIRRLRTPSSSSGPPALTTRCPLTMTLMGGRPHVRRVDGEPEAEQGVY